MLTPKGANMRVTSFQRTPTMFLAMWRFVKKGK
jgi:hypothetical protein